MLLIEELAYLLSKLLSSLFRPDNESDHEATHHFLVYLAKYEKWSDPSVPKDSYPFSLYQKNEDIESFLFRNPEIRF